MLSNQDLRMPKLKEKTRQQSGTKPKEPNLYKVLLHNDDYTTQDFVVFVLTSVFRKPESEARSIMLAVHRTGIGVAGIYTHDVAQTKAERVRRLAEAQDFPLLCSVEGV
jgi:ATP-dependent Clp protease adaptor protein ClpS